MISNSNNRSRSSMQDHSSNASSIWGRVVVFLFFIMFFWAVALEIYDFRELTISISRTFSSKMDSSDEVVASYDSVEHHIRSDTRPDLQMPSCHFIHHLEQSLDKAIDKISISWNISFFPNFLTMMHIPPLSWDLQKAKFLELFIEQSQKHGSKNRTYVAGFSGSSVTAGHDNFFKEAFPSVFEAAMSSVFISIGMHLVVRNHALGNNPCYAYDACIATHLGDDLDMLVWEQSMNCGRTSKPLDTFSRAALRMPRNPAVLYALSGGPSWSSVDCTKLNITDGIERPLLSNEELALLKMSYKDISRRSALMNTMDFLKDDKEELFDRFSTVSPMGQSIFPIDSYKCYGPYNRNFSVKSTGSGAPWHPGKLGHKLRGDSIAYALLMIAKDALGSLKAITPCTNSSTSYNNVRSRALQASLHERSLASSSHLLSLDDIMKIADLSPPITPAESKLIEQHLYSKFHNVSHSFHFPAIIMHTYASIYVYKQLNTPIAPVPSHYDVSETQYPPSCHTDFEPRISNAMSDIIVPPLVNWTRSLSFFDAAAVEKAEKKGLGYLDRKIIYTSQGVGSTLSLRVSPKHASPIWLCECQKGFLKYPAYMADLIDGASITIQYNYYTPNNVNMKTSASARLELLSDQCYRTNSIPPGEHLLQITQKTSQQINLAYVITW